MNSDASAKTQDSENSAAFFVRALVHDLRGDVEGLRGLVALLCAALLDPWYAASRPGYDVRTPGANNRTAA